jgi:cysteine desulfurase
LEKIYFDNAATTITAPEVIDAMIPYYCIQFGNASSVHSFGNSVKVKLEDARENIADFLGVKPKEIFFTSGGTESNNTAIKGLAFSEIGKKRKHIITSTIEHPSVLESIDFLKRNLGFEVDYISPGKNGEISLDKISEKISNATLLVSVMHSNNELGTINDIKKISEITSEKNIFLHSDTVQSIGKVKLNLKNLNANFASFSAHKFYGSKGIGILYIKEGTLIEKFSSGGSQERNIRGGTENIPAIIGMNEAINLLRKNFDIDIEHYKNLRSHLLNKLKKIHENKIIFNSGLENGLPNIVNVSFKPESFSIDPETFFMNFDLKGVALSIGSACSSGSLKPSKILLEIGRDEKTALCSLRISFGRYNKIEEVDYLINVLYEILNI